MKCTVISYSLSSDPLTLDEWRQNLKHEIKAFIDEGSKVILYPEFFLMGVAQYLKGSEIDAVAEFTMGQLLPELTEILRGQDIFLVLGSGPRKHDGKIFNSCPIFFKDQWHFQDKLFLTPWETDFTPGSVVHSFEFSGLKTSVVICYDSEQPDLAVKLKVEGVDLLLIPSATTNVNGSNRVNRCASARAIELGAAVLTSPLIGDSKCDLVDHNEGRQGFFLPAQEDVTCPQETFSEYSTSGKVIGHYELNTVMLRKTKLPSSETKPFHKALHSGLKIVAIS